MSWFRFLHLHLFHNLNPSISNHHYQQQDHNHLHQLHLNQRNIYFSVCSLIFLLICSTFFVVNSMVVVDVTSFNSDTINKPIRPITCSDAKGNQGICMFSLACRQSKGKPIGICKDTIYAGSCCQLPGDEPKPFNGFNSVNINHNQNIYSTKLPTLVTKATTTMITTVIPSIPSTTRSTVQTSSQQTTSTPPPKPLVLTTMKLITTTQLPVTTLKITTSTHNLTTPSSVNISTATSTPPPSLPSSTMTTTPPRTTLKLSSLPPSSSSTTTSIPLTITSTTTETTKTQPPSTVLPLSFSSSSVTSSSLPITIKFPSTEPPPTIPTTITETITNTEAITTVISSSTSSSFSTETVMETVTTETQPSSSSSMPTSTQTVSTDSSSNLTFLSTVTSSSSSTATSPPPTKITSDLPVTIVNLLNKANTKRPYNNKLDCGVSPLKSMARVVGGRNAHFGEWPWQVLIKEATWLGLWMKTKCGGVLIDHRWVLTAAHCQPGFWGSLLVVVGEYDLTGDVENLKPIQKPVKRMIVHRNYNPSTFENDIALMELESPFDVQPHVVPICLPEPGEDFVGQVAHVAGWGKLSYGGPIPSILQVVKLPILANDKCQEMFDAAGHDKEIKSTFLCAGYTDGGKDSCEGDSGGPLMVQRSNGHWVLVGTVSHGIKCAEPNLPGVYMKTAAYRLWIDNIIKRTNYKISNNNLKQSNNNNSANNKTKT